MFYMLERGTESRDSVRTGRTFEDFGVAFEASYVGGGF